MKPDNSKLILEKLVQLATQTAFAIADLINDGDPFTASSTEPGSLSRANDLRGQAKELLSLLDSSS